MSDIVASAQAQLDECVLILQREISNHAVEAAHLNELNDHLPTITILSANWLESAHLLKEHEAFELTYLRNMSGVDLESHMEVVYHLISLERNQPYCFKVKTDRDQPSIPSVTSVWSTANWNEREIYDLLGINFPGHPNLTRIMMPDDWEGHPLRKDYVPLDSEV